MKQNSNNMHTYFSIISLHLCIFCCTILLSKRSSAADYRYTACSTPANCGNGSSISFPFYIPSQQESYCGYPGFALNCSPQIRSPLLELNGNNFIVDYILYKTRSLRVYDAAAVSSGDMGCVPRIKNTTLPIERFKFAGNVTRLHLFYNCIAGLFGDDGFVRVCGGGGVDGDLRLPLYEGDERFASASENCRGDVVAAVEKGGGLGRVGEALKRGFVLNWTASDCGECEESGGRCGFNVSSYLFSCFCPDRPHSRSCKPDRRSTTLLATAIAGGGVFLLLCILIPFIIWKCKKRFNFFYLFPRNISSDLSSKSDIEGGSNYFGIPVFSYTELEEATNNFDTSKELGDGGFGTVYYGKLPDGREVAVKRLYKHNCRRVEQFMNEIRILTSLRHPNLVSLYGCTSRRSEELLLVYEYVPNGTVADHLHGGLAPLTWAVRFNIALETASALAYLHKSDIVHRDVKTSNILLDGNFSVKVADFGLSRLFPGGTTYVSTAPQGTPGYVDPEYHRSYQLTDRSDVYSFGVVLVELVSSMPAVDLARHTNEINLANLAMDRIQRRAFDQLIDKGLGCEGDGEIMRMATSVAELAFWCLQLEKEMRPSMDEVLNFLKGVRGSEAKYADGEMKVPPSPGMDDGVLLEKKNFQPSPNAVTDKWVSSSTTTDSVG